MANDTTASGQRTVPGSNTRKWVAISGGGIAGGLRYGRPRFTLDDGKPPYLMLRGQLSLEVLGVPFQLGFDRGTDVRTRGWRNDLRLELDSKAMTERAQRQTEDQLGILDKMIDSLNYAKADLERSAKGKRYEMDMNNMGADFMQGVKDKDTIKIDEIDMLNQDEVQSESNLVIDSLRSNKYENKKYEIEQIERQISKIDNEIESMTKVREKLALLANVDRQGLESGRNLLRVNSFSIGRVAPSHSTFLINGVTLQGISSCIQKGDVRAYVDVGRTFDEEFMQRGQTPDRLRAIQETVFFQDARGTGRKRLASFRVGPGDPSGTHVHVGLMRGVALLSSSGMGAENDIILGSTNHVLEMSTGLRLAPGHVLSMVVARSLMRPEGVVTSDRVTGADLFERKDELNQAVQLGWSSRFDRTRTQVELTGRTVDPFFQSMGMAFVRHGSRSLNANVGQPIGKRLKLRTSYRIEERSTDGGAGSTVLRRIRLNGVYKISKQLQLRGGYTPMGVRTQVAGTPTLRSTNRIVEFGWNLRRNVRKGSISWTCDVTGYEWEQMNGDVQGQRAATLMTDLAWEGESVSAALSASYFGNAMVAPGEDEAAVSGRLSAGLGSKSRIHGRYTLPLVGAAISGWSCSLERSIKNRWMMHMEVGKAVEQELVSMEMFGNDPVSAYSCEVTIGYSW